MTVIALSRDFLPDVISGSKVSTIRRGRRTYRLGDAVLRGDDQDVPIDIRRIRYLKFRDLTEQDALRDGFENLTELRTALLRFYSQLQPNDDLTVIEFVVKDGADS